MVFKARNVLIGLMPLLISQAAQAATATGTLAVTANVGTACTVGVGTNLLPFGTFVPGGAALDVNGLLQVTCTNLAPYTVALNAGTGAGATLALRILTNPSPAGTLQYSIYTDPSRTTVWGDGTAGSATVAGTGNGTTQSITVPGRIFAGQAGTATPGNYTDSVTITVTF